MSVLGLTLGRAFCFAVASAAVSFSYSTSLSIAGSLLSLALNMLHFIHFTTVVHAPHSMLVAVLSCHQKMLFFSKNYLLFNLFGQHWKCCFCYFRPNNFDCTNISCIPRIYVVSYQFNNCCLLFYNVQRQCIWTAKHFFERQKLGSFMSWNLSWTSLLACSRNTAFLCNKSVICCFRKALMENVSLVCCLVLLKEKLLRLYKLQAFINNTTITCKHLHRHQNTGLPQPSHQGVRPFSILANTLLGAIAF